MESIFENTLSCAFGVFDGHGDYGKKVSDFLSENFMGKKTNFLNFLDHLKKAIKDQEKEIGIKSHL